jgi:hypothetical protein
MSTILLLTCSNVFMTFALVRAFEIRARLAPLESDSGLLGHRTARILPGGPRESSRLCRVLGISAQDHSRGCHDRRLHRICDPVSEGETRMELSRGIRLSRRGCILRLCVQGCRLKLPVRTSGCRWPPFPAHPARRPSARRSCRFQGDRYRPSPRRASRPASGSRIRERRQGRPAPRCA